MKTRIAFIGLYWNHTVHWREPVAQRQHYFGVELYRLFLGLVLTLRGPR